MLQSDTLEEVTQSLPNKSCLLYFFSLIFSSFSFPINLLLWEKKKILFPCVVSTESLLIQDDQPKKWESF